MIVSPDRPERQEPHGMTSRHDRLTEAQAHMPDRRTTITIGGHAISRLSAICLLAALALLVVCACSIAFGSRPVTINDVTRALSPGTSDIAAQAIRLRFPRTALGILIGASLGVAGALMQGVARNPLADPSILGLNTGAAFAIVCSIAFMGLATPIQYVGMALLGSAATAAAVWTLGSMGGSGPTPLKLTLAGAVISAVLGSLISAILLPRVDVISTFRFWQVGGLSGARFPLIAPLMPLFAIGFALAFGSARALNALALGDQLAAGLGLRINRTRLRIWIAAVLLCSAATSLAGPIGFVGLIVPHAARLVIGSDYRRILVLSSLMGPLLLLSSDVLGRIVTRPADVEVGIVTALIGAPIFVALVRRHAMRGV